MYMFWEDDIAELLIKNTAKAAKNNLTDKRCLFEEYLLAAKHPFLSEFAEREAFVIQTLLGLLNLNIKRKKKRIFISQDTSYDILRLPVV